MSLAKTLSEYQPRNEVEAADLRRVKALLARPDPWSRSTPLHITGSAVIVHPPSKRVLLRWHRRHNAWLQIGGHADPGETDPLVTVLREGHEETGLEDLIPWPTIKLLHLVIVPVPANAAEPAHEHADLRYVLATGQPDAVRPESRDSPLRWLSIEEAIMLTTEDNLRETLSRIQLQDPSLNPTSVRK